MTQSLFDTGLLGRNLTKCDELKEGVRWAAIRFVNTCFSLGLQFTISEVFRSQSRQDELYKKGRRGIPGEKPVTWTRKSKHTEGLAMDVYPVKQLSGPQLLSFYKDLDDVANRFGIYRPPELVKLGDYGHFQYDKVIPPSKPITPKARLEGLKKRYKTTTNESVKPYILKEIERLERRLGNAS